jgi:hypothetical protein
LLSSIIFTDVELMSKPTSGGFFRDKNTGIPHHAPMLFNLKL